MSDKMLLRFVLGVVKFFVMLFVNMIGWILLLWLFSG